MTVSDVFTGKEITGFSFTSPAATGTISGAAIAVTVPYGTNVTGLTPTVNHTGSSYTPTGAQDFTSPVPYTVTAADGSTQDYTVTVTVAPNPAKEITTFSFASLATGTISGTAIAVTVPYGTDVTNLTPTVTHTGSSYTPTGAKNFTNPVTYRVTAANGSTQDYTVTVTPAPPPNIAIYWEGDETTDRNGDTINWGVYDRINGTPKMAKAVLSNAPAGFDYLRWTFKPESPHEDQSADTGLRFGNVNAPVKDSSEMSIVAASGTTTAKIHVWNCDSTGNPGTVEGFIVVAP
jgi:hypothetical protein